jgi:hypothetical protein
LPIQRLIESVVGLEVAQDFRADRTFAGKWSAGHEPDHEERRRDDHEQDRDGLQQAPGDEAKHERGTLARERK